MAYIDDNLMPGERVVYRGKLHWAVFLWPAVFGLLGLLWLSSDTPGFGVFLLLVAACVGLPALTTFVTTEFGVTNKRVLAKTGFIRWNSVETLLTKVEGIEVNQGILGRMLNYGTVKIRGTGGSEKPFPTIAAPLVLRREVQQQIEAAHGTRSTL